MSTPDYSVYVDPFALVSPFGGPIYVPNHKPEQCSGENCTLHNPSDHHMVGWQLNWRSDNAIFERMCPEHGVGHPDPDSLAYLISVGAGTGADVHGCCGCCRKDENG